MFCGAHHAFHRWVLQEKARIAKAAAANQIQMDGDDGTTPAPLKRRATPDADMEAEDIDEETELLYAQAVAMADNEQEMAVDEAEDDENEKRMRMRAIWEVTTVRLSVWPRNRKEQGEVADPKPPVHVAGPSQVLAEVGGLAKQKALHQ